MPVKTLLVFAPRSGFLIGGLGLKQVPLLGTLVWELRLRRQGRVCVSKQTLEGYFLDTHFLVRSVSSSPAVFLPKRRAHGILVLVSGGSSLPRFSCSVLEQKGGPFLQ